MSFESAPKLGWLHRIGRAGERPVAVVAAASAAEDRLAAGMGRDDKKEKKVKSKIGA